MTLVAKVDNVALPDGALLIGGTTSAVPAGIQGLPTAAYFGEAMFGGLSIDDPEGVYDFDGLHTFTVDETADTDRPRIWNGLLTGRRVHRGPYKSGPSRVWDVDIWEMNLLFALMVFRASSAKRPAETDIVRMQYIMESAPMAFTPSVDNGRANYTDNPISFDESDLVTRYPIEAINEFASISGKNFYNYWDHDAEENSIHYDLIGVGPAASVTITNDEADTLDSTTFRPFLDAELDAGTEWTVTGMLFGYKGAYAYGIRQATIDALSPTIFSDPEFQRDEVYRTDRVGRLTTANALIQTMLNDRATDRVTIRCSIRVPAAVVNEGIEAGDLVTVKFTHLPGYETEVDIPIIRRNVVPTEGRVDMYDVHLELSGVGKPTGPGGGDPGPFPQQEPCDPDDIGLVQKQHSGLTDLTAGVVNGASWPAPPTEGNFLIACWGSAAGDAGTMAGWTKIGPVNSGTDAQMTVFYRIADGTEATTVQATGSTLGGAAVLENNCYLLEFSGVDTLEMSDTRFELSPYTGSTAIPITPATGRNVIIFTAMTWAAIYGLTTWWNLPDVQVNEYIQTSPFPDNPGGEGPVNIGSLEPYYWLAHSIYTPADGSTYELGSDWIGTGQQFAGVVMSLYCSGSDQGCPSAGVWKRNETIGNGDGTTTNFFTACPYAVGSLIVKVDGVPVVNGLTEVDNTTGEFSLDFAPKAAVGDTRAEVITADYQGI